MSIPKPVYTFERHVYKQTTHRIKVDADQLFRTMCAVLELNHNEWTFTLDEYGIVLQRERCVIEEGGEEDA